MARLAPTPGRDVAVDLGRGRAQVRPQLLGRQGGGHQPDPAVDVVADAAGRDRALVQVHRGDPTDGEPIPPVDVGHGQREAQDAGQVGHVAHLLQRRIVRRRRPGRVDPPRDLHPALAGELPEITVDAADRSSSHDRHRLVPSPSAGILTGNRYHGRTSTRRTRPARSTHPPSCSSLRQVPGHRLHVLPLGVQRSGSYVPGRPVASAPDSSTRSTSTAAGMSRRVANRIEQLAQERHRGARQARARRPPRSLLGVRVLDRPASGQERAQRQARAAPAPRPPSSRAPGRPGRRCGRGPRRAGGGRAREGKPSPAPAAGPCRRRPRSRPAARSRATVMRRKRRTRLTATTRQRRPRTPTRAPPPPARARRRRGAGAAAR